MNYSEKHYLLISTNISENYTDDNAICSGKQMQEELQDLNLPNPHTDSTVNPSQGN